MASFLAIFASVRSYGHFLVITRFVPVFSEKVKILGKARQWNSLSYAPLQGTKVNTHQYFTYSYINICQRKPAVLFFSCSVDGTTTFCNQTGDLTENNTVYISKQLLINNFTRADEGWEIWHNVLIIVGIIVITRSAAYLVLRYIRKPKAV